MSDMYPENGKRNWFGVALILLIVVIIAGAWWQQRKKTSTANSTPTTTATTTETPATTDTAAAAAPDTSKVISYDGVEGKNALDLLKASHQVDAQHFDFGDMVQGIDGVKAPDGYFWEFRVNGQPSESGASAYTTKSTDKITWQLSKAQ